MTFQTGQHWSTLLKPAVLCMNSTFKKSHSSTPFQVMWGRESKYENLVSDISKIKIAPDEDYQLEEAILSETLPAQECEMLDTFSPPEDHLESIHFLNESRNNTRKRANVLIKSEQLKQKRQYDKKVNEKRYAIFIIYTNIVHIDYYF